MANYQGILIGLGLAGAIIGALFGTGVVELHQASETSETSEEAPRAPDDGDAATEDRKGPRRERGPRGRRGWRGKRSALQSLAYLGDVPLEESTRELVGVHRNDPRAYRGFMLANATGGIRGNTATVREAVLYDHEGKEAHRWSSDVPSKLQGWAMARLDASGYLYAVVTDGAVIKLDWQSNVVWMAEGRFHHDLTITEDGDIAALAERRLVVAGPAGTSHEVRLLDHGVVTFDADGAVKEQLWIYEIMKDQPAFQANITRAVRKRGGRVIAAGKGDERGGAIDAFHANSVVILPRDVEGLGRTGDILLSLRNMNMVATIDRESKQATWVWGSADLYKQHDATLTPEGNVVLFDNRNPVEKSRALIVDPRTNTIVRTIGGPGATGPLRFFSWGRGLAQALPNGNVMVVVSNEGRAFEVDGSDEVLWEFWSPWKGDQTRKPIRGARLEGPVQTALAAIVAGEAPAPAADPGGMRSFKVEFGGAAPVGQEADDDQDADAGTDGDDEPQEAQPPAGPGDSPTGQDTPVPPSPQ